MKGARPWLAGAYVGLVMSAVGIAIWAGPATTRVWMLILSVGTAAFAVQSAVSDPGDLTLTLLLATAPLLALLGEGSPSWLIGPLAVMLLLGGELNAAAWANQGRGDPSLDPVGLDPVDRARLARSVRLAGLALLAAVGITLLGRTWVSGRGLAFVVGVAGLVGLAAIVVPRRP